MLSGAKLHLFASDLRSNSRGSYHESKGDGLYETNMDGVPAVIVLDRVALDVTPADGSSLLKDGVGEDGDGVEGDAAGEVDGQDHSDSDNEAELQDDGVLSPRKKIDPLSRKSRRQREKFAAEQEREKEMEIRMQRLQEHQQKRLEEEQRGFVNIISGLSSPSTPSLLLLKRDPSSAGTPSQLGGGGLFLGAGKKSPPSSTSAIRVQKKKKPAGRAKGYEKEGDGDDAYSSEDEDRGWV